LGLLMPEPTERAPIADAPLSVALLAHNVAGHLERIVRDWAAFLDSLAREYEILIVDDASTDRTREQAEGLTQLLPRLQACHAEGAPGIGSTLRKGVSAARLPLLCYAECSPAYRPADLGRMLELIDHVDLVCGYRERQAPRPRPWRDWLFGLAVRLVFGVPLKDVDCPFKLFRREIFPRIPIQSEGPFVHAEIVAKANFLGCLIAEVPVSFEPQASSNTLDRPAQQWADAYRVFRHPDFGPPNLSSPSK
jgi:glycosyltransferase involved in cell wall biosynthesis